MSEFKERADLRTGELKKLLFELEKKRDALMDEAASARGKVAVLEEIIRRCYEITLDVNKEEQNKELTEILKTKQKEAFSEATRGIKTPKRPRKDR